MAIYIYETIPERDGEEPRTFEIQQSMKDSAFTHEPHTGLRVRRVISGGLGIIGRKRGFSSAAAGNGAPPGDSGCCGACHA
jgi:predicted nucleic acid-binding Zn ribbon protein